MTVGDADAPAGSVHWPTLTADEAVYEWDALLTWVSGFMARYPNGVRIPDCWWHHTDLVEALSALRDHERASFSRRNSPVAAVEWQRARRDVEQSLELWIRRLPCAVPGRGHRQPEPLTRRPDGWPEHVAADVERRHTAEPGPAGDDGFPDVNAF